MASYYDQVNGLAPKVWYRFNETAGTPTNSGSLTTTASFVTLLLNEQTDVDGRATYFEGAAAHIKINPWPAFSLFDDKSFTVETWFKLQTLDGSDRTLYRFSGFNPISNTLSIVCLGTASGNSGKLLLKINGLGNQTADADTYSVNTYNDNKWHHVVVAVNTTSLKWYIDGNLITTKTLTTGTLNWDSYNSGNGYHRLIGTGRSNVSDSLSTAKYRGWLDEFAIYGYELSAQQVLDNFNAGASVEFASDVLGTASALALQPTVTTTAELTVDPMTASSDGAGHAASTVNFPTMLETYMAGRTLETWYKFNISQQLTNYGSLPTKVSVFETDASTVPSVGIQGSGALLTTGGTNGGVINLSDNVGPLIADKDFSFGFWVKKSTNETASIMGFYDSGTSGDAIEVFWNANGSITTNAIFNNNHNDIVSSTDYADGNWHYVAVRQSGNTLQMWIDNTSIGTQTITHSYSAIDYVSFGNGDQTRTEKMYISQFYVATAANITSTEIANIYTAGTSAETQASASMPEAKTRFNSAFNDYIVSKNPLLDFRLDEGTGAPLDYGSAGLVVVSQQSPQGYTQNETTLNTRGFKFTDRLQAIRGNYALATGTLSSANECTIGIVFKNANATNQQGLVGFGGRGGTQGTGFSLQQLASSGYLRIIAGSSNGTTTNFTGTKNVGDNNWHLAVIVKEASTIKLYLDGKLDISSPSSHTLTDSGEFSIAAISGIDAATASRDTLIDEIFVTAGAFSAQEVFEAWRSLRLEMDTTATASLPMPTNIAGTGTTQTVDEATASSLFEMPTFSTDQVPTINPATASAEFLLPNFGGNVVIDANYGHEVFTASAVFHDPQFQIGDFHSADHMNASALFVHPISTGGGTIAVPTAVALDATFVMPGIVTIKGAQIFAEPARANAALPLPPAYVQLTDDNWFNLLLAGHAERVIEPVQAQLSNLPNQSTTDVAQGGFLSFFDDLLADRTPTTTTNTVTSEIPNFYFKRAESYSYDNNGNILAPDTTKAIARLNAARASSDPAAILGSGTFDPYERKAARFNNIELPLPGTDIYYSQRPYNIEFSFKSTKQDQIIAYGKWNSFNGYARNIGVIGLADGKIYLAEDAYKVFSPDPIVGLNDYRANIPATAPHPKNFVNRAEYLLGRKNIADGQWHHVIIQQGWTDGRTQIWIDGQLDRQIGVTAETGGGYSTFPGSDGTNRIRPYIIGFNSNDDLLYSDFETSAFNFYPARFITQDKILANFAAYSKWKPVKAEPMTATIRMTDKNAAKGNRPRALLLYWWESGDNGKYGYWDEPTFPLSTIDTKDEPPQQYYGWDIFPIDVIGRNSSDMIKENVWLGAGYRDPITGSPRYLDLMNDIDISMFDAIFFKNYPEQTEELDEYTRTEISDTYFGIQEKTLHENFLESLRKAMDTGISLFVTNSQLALDLGIIDRVERISDLNEGEFERTDTFVVNKFANISGTGQSNIPDTGFWTDTWRNNRLRVVNTFQDITDYPTYLWRDWMYFTNNDSINYGQINRPYISLLDRPNGLQVGDEFIISDAYLYGVQYEAVPFENVKAGTIITAFANTVDRNGVAIENPYRNYATSIAVAPGTILKGRPTVGKIFVNFTERLVATVSQITGAVRAPFMRPHWESRDFHRVELIQDKWINQAYADGSITLEKKNELLASAANLDRRLEAAIAANNQSLVNYINALKYWDFNGENILVNKAIINDPTGSGIEKDGLGDGVRKSIVNKISRKGAVSTRTVSSTAQWFQVTWEYEYPTIQLKVPSLLSNGFSWLADKVVDDGTVNRVEAMRVTTATLPMPTTVGDKDKTVYVQAMVANATIIHAPGYALADVSNTTLPLTANAGFGEFVKNIKPDVFIASALIKDPRTTGIEEDEVVVYMIHVDPILYLREDIIK